MVRKKGCKQMSQLSLPNGGLDFSFWRFATCGEAAKIVKLRPKKQDCDAD
jgi:hypothetical protein